MGVKRINKIISVLPSVETLADVGCDHGFIGIGALNSGVANNVIFIDVSKPSLLKAKKNLPENLQEKAEFVCQDGLKDVTADCAVIAGMGGLEIISILNNCKYLPNKLVLQPMKSVAELREYLSHNYFIDYDEIFCDSKYYNLITATKQSGGCILTQDELTFGKTNLQRKSTDFISYLKKEIKTLKEIYEKCRDKQVQQRLLSYQSVFMRITEEQK